MPIVKVCSEAGKLQFQIIEDGDLCIAKSLQYRTICRLEEALRSLYLISMGPSEVVVITTDGRHQFSSKSTRRRLVLSEMISVERVFRTLAEISDAQIVDSRPPDRRRTDLGGPLKARM
jgi:hypothetical protein